MRLGAFPSPPFPLPERAGCGRRSAVPKHTRQGGKDLGVVCRLSDEGEGIGAAAAGHAEKADSVHVDGLADAELRAMELFGQHGCRFLSCGDDGPALGNPAQESLDIGGFRYLQKSVGGVAPQSSHRNCRVEEGDALPLQKGTENVQTEYLLLRIVEIVLVVEECQSEDAPHIILDIGVEEVHGPPFEGWREAAQHEHLRAGWQKRLQGMAFYGDGGVFHGRYAFFFR